MVTGRPRAVLHPKGAFLQDGESLYEVIGHEAGKLGPELVLQDCRADCDDPNSIVKVTVSRVRVEMKIVRASPSGEGHNAVSLPDGDRRAAT